ncbi:hypothetical protein MRX96_029931 [Rhipicephalus microplus]
MVGAPKMVAVAVCLLVPGRFFGRKFFALRARSLEAALLAVCCGGLDSRLVAALSLPALATCAGGGGCANESAVQEPEPKRKRTYARNHEGEVCGKGLNQPLEAPTSSGNTRREKAACHVSAARPLSREQGTSIGTFSLIPEKNVTAVLDAAKTFTRKSSVAILPPRAHWREAVQTLSLPGRVRGVLQLDATFVHTQRRKAV